MGSIILTPTLPVRNFYAHLKLSKLVLVQNFSLDAKLRGSIQGRLSATFQPWFSLLD